MSRKALLLITTLMLLVSLVATILEFLVEESNVITYIAEGSYAISCLSGGYLLFVYSTIRQTVYWRFMQIAISVLIIGVLFKILHLTGADELLQLSNGAIAVIYLIRFFAKPSKGHLDVLKALSVVSLCVFPILTILHVLPAEYIVIGKIFFWLTLIDFAYLEWRKSPANG